MGQATETQKSRRTLTLPKRAVEALREHRGQQVGQRLLAGEIWQDHGLAFCTSAGAPLDAGNVRRTFKQLTKAVGLGDDWTPRELRTSFVSVMSDSGVPVEEIARLAGHVSSRTTEVVYRRELRPVINTGAKVMDKIFQFRSTCPSLRWLSSCADGGGCSDLQTAGLYMRSA